MADKKYIERWAVIERIKQLCYEDCDKTDSNAVCCENCGIAEVLDIIADAPAVDVAPVVHGEWMLKHVGMGHCWECSVCHTNPCIYVTENTKFCPNCGAKMDGGKK